MCLAVYEISDSLVFLINELHKIWLELFKNCKYWIMLVCYRIKNNIIEYFIFPREFTKFTEALRPIDMSRGSIADTITRPQPEPVELHCSLNHACQVVHLLSRSNLPNVNHCTSFFWCDDWDEGLYGPS